MELIRGVSLDQMLLCGKLRLADWYWWAPHLVDQPPRLFDLFDGKVDVPHTVVSGMDTVRMLAELSKESGIPARTIRFYISRALLNGPVKAGRGAVYTDDHLAGLKKITKLQAGGRMLSEIAHDLAGSPPAGTMRQSPWLQYAVGDDVVVTARGDVSPWRAKRIRAAVESMASLLREPENRDTVRQKR